MYVEAIRKARDMGIGYVADGARISQGFAIELPSMIKEFIKFFGEFSIQLLFPVLFLQSDWKLKNLLLSRGFIPKTFEPQCLIGAPINKVLDDEVQEAVVNYFKESILPRAKEIITDDSLKSNNEGLFL